MRDLEKKVVMITGGAGGMGKAVAKRFLQEGAIVYLSDISEDNLKAAMKEFEEFGDNINYVVTDITQVADCEHLIKTVIQGEGRLDVVVNGAGVWVEGNSDEMTESMWDRTINVNLKGTFFISRYAIPELEKTKGCIVNISSDAGIVGNNGAAIYCASKGGVTLLTKALAIELASRQIRVNAVAPGDVLTPMLEGQARDYGNGNPEAYFKDLLQCYPQGEHARFAMPEEIAETIYFLASPKVEAITGAILSVDFGVTAGY